MIGRRKGAARWPHAKSYIDRHGKRRWRFRQGGFSRELGTDYGSDEFVRRYEDAALDHETGRRAGAGVAGTVPGSFNDLIARWYLTPEFRNLSELTRYGYRRVVEGFRGEHGRKPVAQLERRHVKAILSAKGDTPGAANNLRKRLSQLLDLAIELDWIKTNPARTVKPYRIAGGGFHTWTEAEIGRFFAYHEPGSVPHTAVTLMLYTGAARVDAVALGPLNIRSGRIEYRRSKTVHSGGVLISIPIHPDLSAVLDKLPSDRTYLSTKHNKSRTVNGLGTAMRGWCNNAGLPQCSSHGLRKACARRLAEAGATAHEIMSVTGHKTLAEAQRYTESALRETMADSAFAKLMARPNQEQTAVNLPVRFTGNTGK